MRKYSIIVTEVLSRCVEIVADNDKEAIKTINTMYRNRDIVLDASDYVLTEFRVNDE